MNDYGNPPTEQTALLNSANGGQRTLLRPLPEVGPAAERARAQGGLRFAIPHFADEQTEAAYKLVVLLQAVLSAKSPDINAPSKDAWERWSKETSDASLAREVEAQLMELWKDLLDSGIAGDVETILWTAFPLNDGEESSVRAVNLLADINAPTALLTHRLIDLHLRSVWEHGAALRSYPESRTNSIIRAIDACCTPRISHMVDVIFASKYLLILLSYLLNPPRKPVITDGYIYNFGWRGAMLMIYAFSSLFRPYSVRLPSFLFVFMAFLVCIPTVPMPGDGAFDTLLLGTIIFIVTWIFVPVTPSPIFLRPSLPLATLLWRGFSRVFGPIIVFFLPALAIAASLVSISLSDTLIKLIQPAAGRFVDEVVAPAPIETRAGFLALFFVVAVLALSALVMMVLVVPSTTPQSDGSIYAWDQYGADVGLEARRSFVKALLSYTSPTQTSAPAFPSPFNVVVYILVQAPARLLGLVTRRDVREPCNQVERVLWRLVMAPFAIVLAAIRKVSEALVGSSRRR